MPPSTWQMKKWPQTSGCLQLQFVSSKASICFRFWLLALCEIFMNFMSPSQWTPTPNAHTQKTHTPTHTITITDYGSSHVGKKLHRIANSIIVVPLLQHCYDFYPTVELRTKSKFRSLFPSLSLFLSLSLSWSTHSSGLFIFLYLPLIRPLVLSMPSGCQAKSSTVAFLQPERL